MPSTKLTKSFINNLNIKDITNKVDYFDKEVKGLILRVSPSGTMSYRLKYYISRKARIYTIGKHGAITLLQAKKEAQRLNGLISQNIDIQKNKNEEKLFEKNDITFEYFLENFGYKWYKSNNKCWKRDIQQIQSTFSPLFTKKLAEINDKKLIGNYLEKLRIYNCWKNETYNRNLARIKGLLSRAVENEFIKFNNLKGLKKLKITDKKVRYLSEDETKRFFIALENQAELAKNIVLIAYYTGMRKNEILSLSWNDIDTNTNQIVLVAENTKSNKIRYIPINDKISSILFNKNNERGLIFKNKKGKRVTQIEKQWRKLKKEAQIDNFRFHDLRHNFCSMLVIKGVPIYTVAKLAGHSDVKTTQRYAHLSPDVKKSAIDLL